jgi:hypothetical protein
MKQILSFALSFILLMSGLSCTAQNGVKNEAAVVSDSKIEVYYFHFTRRCLTCNTVESETKKSLETLYPDLVKNGTIVFKSINLDEENGKAVAKKCKVGGQGLLVTAGEKRTDLTSQGFMYARSNPAKLSDAIKKAIDPLLASK